MWDKAYVTEWHAKRREALRHACPRCGADAFKSVLCRPCATAIANKRRNEAGGPTNGWYPHPAHIRGEDGRYR